MRKSIKFVAALVRAQLALILLVWTPSFAAADLPSPGTTFRDCPVCPEMVVIPPGSFTMGTPKGEEMGGQDLVDMAREYGHQTPLHRVTIARAFALGKYEVTFDEWDACVADGGCSHRPADEGWGRGTRPVINVNWYDAKEYVAWLSRKTGNSYRLPSESEWEYAARAGTTTARYWGNAVGVNQANCRDCGSQWDGRQTAPVGQFPANPFGLHDMLGNAYEWLEDCWNGSYRGAPADGAARVTGDCSDRMVRGGSWFSGTAYARAGSRSAYIIRARINPTGFRVVRAQ